MKAPSHLELSYSLLQLSLILSLLRVGVALMIGTFYLKEREIPYILESNPHPLYSFRWLKNQMRIRIACGLDSQS